MPTRPTDEFDRIPKGLPRVGAHRAPRTAGQKAAPWLWFILAAALGSLLLILGLVIGLNNLLVPSIGTPAPTATEPVVQPTQDPAATISVINGTATPGLGDTVAGAITAGGWPGVAEISDADREDVARTAVFYADPALEGAALGLAETLGMGEVVQNDSYAFLGTSLVVLVGADYVPPAG